MVETRVFAVTLPRHFSQHASYDARAPATSKETEKIFLSTPAAAMAASKLPCHLSSFDAVATLCARKCANSFSVSHSLRTENMSAEASTLRLFSACRQSRLLSSHRALPTVWIVSSPRPPKVHLLRQAISQPGFDRNLDQLACVCLVLLQLFTGEQDLRPRDKLDETSQHEDAHHTPTRSTPGHGVGKDVAQRAVCNHALAPRSRMASVI